MRIRGLVGLAIAVAFFGGPFAACFAQDHSKDTTHAQELAWWKAQRVLALGPWHNTGDFEQGGFAPPWPNEITGRR